MEDRHTTRALLTRAHNGLGVPALYGCYAAFQVRWWWGALALAAVLWGGSAIVALKDRLGGG